MQDYHLQAIWKLPNTSLGPKKNLAFLSSESLSSKHPVEKQNLQSAALESRCLGKRRSWSRSACDWCKRAACERQCCVSSLARRNGFCQVWRRSSQALHTRNCQGGSMSMFKHLLGRVLHIHTHIHTYYINDIYIHFNPSKLRIPHLIITDFKPSTCGSVQEDAKRQWCSS